MPIKAQIIHIAILFILFHNYRLDINESIRKKPCFDPRFQFFAFNQSWRAYLSLLKVDTDTKISVFQFSKFLYTMP